METRVCQKVNPFLKTSLFSCHLYFCLLCLSVCWTKKSVLTFLCLVPCSRKPWETPTNLLYSGNNPESVIVLKGIGMVTYCQYWGCINIRKWDVWCWLIKRVRTVTQGKIWRQGKQVWTLGKKLLMETTIWLLNSVLRCKDSDLVYVDKA